MLKNKKITVIIILFFTVIFLWPFFSSFAGAASSDTYYGTNDLIEQGVRLANTDLRTLIANIINVFLGFLGVIGVLIVLYGGFKWMSSQGKAEKIDEAKKIITNGAIGLFIILAAYGIVTLIFKIATGDSGGNGSNNANPPPGWVGGIGLGAGALESHYPARGASGVPRNTMIYLTFKEPMKLDTILANVACAVNCDANAKIELKNLNMNMFVANNDLVVNYSADHKTFEIDPYGNSGLDHLGVNTGSTGYQMLLKSIETATGRPAFPLTGIYDWTFTVSDVLDLTPPTVTSVLPAGSPPDHPRNSAVQIYFSEAVMPNGINGASGVYNAPGDFSNIEVRDTVPNTVRGEYKISNQYRTVEFITDQLCGQNSCGGDVYCLPGGQTLSAAVKGTAPHIIKDMAGNSLDGDGDGTAGGDYSWTFDTNNNVDLNAPVIANMSANTNVLMDAAVPISAGFSKVLLSSSINSANITLVEDSPTPQINFWMSLSADNKTVYINHDKFKPLTKYLPTMYSGIQDNLQNCWYPCRCTDPGGTCSCSADASAACLAGTNCQAP